MATKGTFYTGVKHPVVMVNSLSLLENQKKPSRLKCLENILPEMTPIH